jgi:hypothetical protein
MPDTKLATPEDFHACARAAMSAAIRELVSAYTFATRCGIPDATCIHIDELIDSARGIRAGMEHQ